MIYATPYNQTTKQATGPSVDSGFQTLEEVEGALGCERTGKRFILTGEGDDRIAFSDYKFGDQP